MGELADAFDIDLLVAAQHGDLDAFTSLYRRHGGDVLRYCWSKTGQQQAAEDLAQETFAVAWAKRARATIVDESLLPWLLAISRNHCNNYLRRQVRRHALPLREEEPAPATADEDAAWLRKELGKLSPLDRQLCRLCLVEGLSYREAADALDTTAAAVGKRIQRARARLRAAMGQE